MGRGFAVVVAAADARKLQQQAPRVAVLAGVDVDECASSDKSRDRLQPEWSTGGGRQQQVPSSW